MNEEPAGTGPPAVVCAADKQTVIRVMQFGANNEDVVDRVLVDLAEIPALREQQRVLWIDVDGPLSPEVLAAFGAEFKLHPLALEDVVHTNQRAKFEEYPEHLFAICRMVRLNGTTLEDEQLSVFVGTGFIVTFQEKPGGDCLGSVRERIRRRQGEFSAHGADYLAYALLDAVIDSYFPILDSLDEQLEEVEEELDDDFTSAPPTGISMRLHEIRRCCLKLRRLAVPMRDAVGSIWRNVKNVTEPTRIHLRDCYDHTFRIIDSLEMQRDECLGLREMYQTRMSNYQAHVGNHTNEVMKFLAIITVLFSPLSLIAGIYGMNFNPEKSQYNMPELNWAYGYPFALSLMALVFIGLLTFLYRRGWLHRKISVQNAPPRRRLRKRDLNHDDLDDHT